VESGPILSGLAALDLGFGRSDGPETVVFWFGTPVWESVTVFMKWSVSGMNDDDLDRAEAEGKSASFLYTHEVSQFSLAVMAG